LAIAVVLAPVAAGPRWCVWLRAAPTAWSVAAAWGREAERLGETPGERQQARDGCGPAALSVVLRARGTRVPQRLLWSVCRVRGGGTTLGVLARAAARFGHPAAVGVDPRLEHTPLPAIVHLRRGHFVVLERRDGGRAVIFDPGCGRVRVPMAVLRRRASGAVLAFDTPAAPA
jgi:ABC-type bacteriocin/lantibiotic exporter with double-glycine peptidase domain